MNNPTDLKTTETIDFGFETIGRHQKQRRVRGVFDSVAGNYDLMNDLMSAGIHRIWKSVLLDRLMPRPGQHLLDVAGGTGDVGIGFLKRAEDWAHLHPARVEGKVPAIASLCDINHEMLKAGQSRTGHGLDDQISRICGNAEQLPLPARSVDAYSIAFGIRNVTDREAALREACRVLRPGGRFICLEFSHLILESLQKLYDQYSFNVIPWLGEQVTGDRASYQYLVESIRKFPTQDAFAAQIRSAGFSRVKVENLTGGVAALHMAWRL
ncbi:MAG: class I SAM-dependent methyltransferase [Pseudomonadota bacterium]